MHRRTLITQTAALALALPTALGRTAAAQPGATPRATPRAGEDGGYAHPGWLVDPAWVAAHLDDPTVRIVALTPPADFAAGHIPGAAQVDWAELGVTDTSDPSIAAWQAEVEGILTRLGISPGQTVVIADGGTLFAARLWWVLEQLGHPGKRILNGGLPAWTAGEAGNAAGAPLETGAATVAPADTPYEAAPNPEVLATMALVEASLGDAGVVLVDARTPEEYAAGHIPGAVNLPFAENASAEDPKIWRDAADLRARYAALGATPDKRVIPYCATGVRSAVTYFTLRLLGYPDVRLYTGSWEEWSGAH